MVGGPVDFIPSYSLFYTNRGQKKMYELLGVRTQLQFAQYLGKPDGLEIEDTEKMIVAGLVWEHPDITLEKVQDLIDSEFYIKQGGDLETLNANIIEAFVNSGLLNKEKIETAKKISKLATLQTVKNLDDKIRDAEGEDMGNR